jgi:hypothetical protein
MFGVLLCPVVGQRVCSLAREQIGVTPTADLKTEIALVALFWLQTRQFSRESS